MSSVSQEFVSKLRSLGYNDLTSIQKLAIPSIIKGFHTLVIAPTGYGKTEAAIIPIFYSMFMKRPKKISALYVTPLRALNRDLELRLKRLAEAFEIKVGTRHGDNSRKERKDVVLNPPDLLLTTPETLLYLIVDRRMKQLFRNIRWVVIDELQEMLDEKRGYELSVVLQRLKRLSNDRIQFIGLSATISDVDIAKAYLSLNEDVEVVKVDGRKDTEISIEIPEPSQDDVERSIRSKIDPTLLARLRRLKEIIENNKPVLIFTNTRETAEYLSNQLQTVYGLKVFTHHGSLSKEVRIEIERKFKESEVDAIVATSSLELGIDIGSVSLVVQYMSPRQATRLLQRVGRSGHSMNKVSKGIVIPGNYLYDVLECKAITELSREGYLEPLQVEKNPLDVLAHQLAGMVIEGPVKIGDALEVFRQSPYFRTLSEEEINEVISQLEAERIVRKSGDYVKASRRTWKYYYSVNMIPDSNLTYSVIEVDGNRKVGNLDFDFVLILDQDSVFILAGRLWKVISIEEGKVFVSSTELKKGDLPSWFGEAIAVEKEVSMRVYEYLSEMFSSTLNATDEIRKKVEEYKRRGYPIPTKNEIIVELVNSDLIIIHTPFGTKGNNTLGSLISAMLAERGIRSSYRSDSYHVVITTISPLNKGEVTDILNRLIQLNEEIAIRLIESNIVNSPQFKWALLIEAQRFGAIDKGVEMRLGQLQLKAYSETVIGKEAIKESLLKLHDLSIIELLNGVSWKVIEVPSPSPLAQEFLERLMAYTRSDEGPIMTEVFKRRLLTKEIRVICLLCAWNSNMKVQDVPERCPKCGSIFITSTYTDDEEAVQLIRKNIKGEKLTWKERRKLDDLNLISSLFSNYGKIAFVALAVRGVGPSNLGRIMRTLSQGEATFYQTLMEEERKFIRYRKYWQ
ncbi:DEAD/DEAH box helicase [Metallosphaera tengchongensis]|uniref:DEAD/DEAH box helicase n=1 Tax=Metallosphaera tengchongensis TaxID=1532350 RepID=A0A6N0NUK9_9CREN|nr:DEAD/DEAH box helicase [Metallosphaera tengchongensis]QKQ99816.1 DEAD/DEAH box helicase [Metallosphaera tengchongensis]